MEILTYTKTIHINRLIYTDWQHVHLEKKQLNIQKNTSPRIRATWTSVPVLFLPLKFRHLVTSSYFDTLWPVSRQISSLVVSNPVVRKSWFVPWKFVPVKDAITFGPKFTDLFKNEDYQWLLLLIPVDSSENQVSYNFRLGIFRLELNKEYSVLIISPFLIIGYPHPCFSLEIIQISLLFKNEESFNYN